MKKMHPRFAQCIACVGALLALAGWGGSCLAQTLLAQSAPAPLGTTVPGASRQAWAAAAALSRGITLATALEPAAEFSKPGFNAQTIAQARFRSVRLVVPPASLRSAGTAVAEQELRLQRLDHLIDVLLARGLSVVLAIRDEPGSAAYSTQARSQAAIEARHRQLVQIWQQLARRYSKQSHRLLFEIAFDPGASSAAKNQRVPFLLKAIRQSDPTRVVVLGWGEAIGVPDMRLPEDRHLIVGIAHAEPFRFIRQEVPGLPGADQWRGTTCCSPQEMQLMALPLDIVKAWSVEHHYPVWVHEFMSYKEIPADLRARHARLVRQAAEDRGFSWAYGDFDRDFGIYDPVSQAWQAPVLRALLGP